jgi:hypothetical protein
MIQPSSKAACVLVVVAMSAALQAIVPEGARGADAESPQAVRFLDVQAQPFQAASNLLANASFEEGAADGIPAGWRWDRRNTDALCRLDPAQHHSGRQSVLVTNGTLFGAHVYGMLWRARPVRLVEGRPYAVSAWVKSEAPGIVSLIGGEDWHFRIPIPATGGEWRRVWKTFTPGSKDCDFVLRISTESPTRGVWIDDVKLEAGPLPTPDVDPAAKTPTLIAEASEPETVVQGEGAFHVGFVLALPEAADGTVEASLGSDEPWRQPLSLGAGLWRLSLNGTATAAHDAPGTLTLQLKAAAGLLAQTQTRLRFFSAANARQRLAALRERLPALKTDLEAVSAGGQDVSYPRVTFTVLDQFTGFAAEDAEHGEVKRALEQVAELEAMAARLSVELAQARAGQRTFAPVPRWTGSQRPVVRGSSFVAPVRLGGGRVETRPVFFNGYGHFNRVVTDMERWPAYGANVIQIEFGPSSVFPAENQTNAAPMRAFRETLDRAQRAGVGVCLLISPHYLPHWAFEKWPHLRKRREGFLQYCLHAPEGRDLLRQFIYAALPTLKDHPALHSICLSNEPVNEEEPCEAGRELWQVWLQAHHGEIATLNSLCRSNFASFAAVPLPDPFGPRPHAVLWQDFIRFNQEFFAGWHAAMARTIHEVAPGLPVHAKPMTWTFFNDGDLKYGVDATLFGRLSDINGNDSVNFYEHGEGEFAQGWQLNAMGHDLQRSVLDAPVFNTENHLIPDRDTRPVPPAHIRAALWQAAVHGQSATAIWVWERTFDPKSDFAGSIMHRPGCAEAVGWVNHDLNRAAVEVTALQQARPQVLLLQSVTAAVWDGGRYTDCLGKLYAALAFTGLKAGFITERQLEAGVTPDAPVLFVPAVTHLSRAALTRLRGYGGRLVYVGDGDLLSLTEYGQPAEAKLAGDRIPFRHGPTTARELHVQLLAKLSGWGVQPAVALQGSDGRAPWGVAWRSAESGGTRLVNVCNYLRTPATVTLGLAGHQVPARDVLSAERIASALTLQPLEIRLLRLE